MTAKSPQPSIVGRDKEMMYRFAHCKVAPPGGTFSHLQLSKIYYSPKKFPYPLVCAGRHRWMNWPRHSTLHFMTIGPPNDRQLVYFGWEDKSPPPPPHALNWPLYVRQINKRLCGGLFSTGLVEEPTTINGRAESFAFMTALGYKLEHGICIFLCVIFTF